MALQLETLVIIIFLRSTDSKHTLTNVVLPVPPSPTDVHLSTTCSAKCKFLEYSGMQIKHWLSMLLNKLYTIRTENEFKSSLFSHKIYELMVVNSQKLWARDEVICWDSSHDPTSHQTCTDGQVRRWLYVNILFRRGVALGKNRVRLSQNIIVSSTDAYRWCIFSLL